VIAGEREVATKDAAAQANRSDPQPRALDTPALDVRERHAQVGEAEAGVDLCCAQVHERISLADAKDEQQQKPRSGTNSDREAPRFRRGWSNRHDATPATAGKGGAIATTSRSGIPAAA